MTPAELDDAQAFAVNLEAFGKTHAEIEAGKLIKNLIKALDNVEERLEERTEEVGKLRTRLSKTY